MLTGVKETIAVIVLNLNMIFQNELLQLNSNLATNSSRTDKQNETRTASAIPLQPRLPDPLFSVGPMAETLKPIEEEIEEVGSSFAS